MSRATSTTRPANLLPVLPETRAVEPLVQCGVLYLGTSPSKNSRRGLDGVQEPFSYQYPVDGTNTARGIDGVLSVYDNGLQLAFTRQPETVVFFPISSLLYCASLRFSIIKNDPARSTRNVHWRFLPLDTSSTDENKHPPLFCAVMQRTHLLPGDECHCFITKTMESALALVQMTSRVYSKMQLGLKSPILPLFYQLDHLGRKISEARDLIYLSPAHNEDGVLNRVNPIRLRGEAVARKYLSNPSLGGYYYRTDLSLIEQWQLWDDNDLTGCRPHPPDSPFGLHEGLYHDDTTKEIQRYLRHMDKEDDSSSCCCSIQSSCSSSSISTEYSRRRSRRRRSKKTKASDDTDQFDIPLPPVMASSFEPPPPKHPPKSKKARSKPIIIEKILPKSVPLRSKSTTKASDRQQNFSVPRPKSTMNYISSSDRLSFSYRLNERGEKITKDGNRIIFMDVVRPAEKVHSTDSPTYIPVKPRSRPHQRRSTRTIPVVDIQRLDELFNEKQLRIQRRTSLPADSVLSDHLDHENYLTTVDILEILNKYVGDYRDGRFQSDRHEAQSVQEQYELPEQEEHKRRNSVMSSTDSSRSETRFRRSRSTIGTGPSVHSGEHPSKLSSSSSHSQASSTGKQKLPLPPPVLTDQDLDEYVSNIYGTAGSVKSTVASSTHQEVQSINQSALATAGYASAFRYMQSSLNANYLQDYRNCY